MTNKLIITSLIAVAALALFSSAAFAQIRLPNAISSNMVLQQGKKVPVWGWCEPGEKVSVNFAGQTVKTISNTDGSWKVELAPLAASSKPSKLTIRTRHNKVVLDNILTGEVWLAGGQSNMEYRMNRPEKLKKPAKREDVQGYELEHGRNPLIRMLYVSKVIGKPDIVSKGWEMLNDESIQPLSAPAYFFAKDLCDSLKVPVGIISSSWGGSRIEVWTPEQAYLDSPVFASKVTGHKLDGQTIGEQYATMIAPIAPMALRGFIWYQGESNVMAHGRELYAQKQKVLVDAWRSAWGDSSLSFYYVQLSPFRYSVRRGDDISSTWEELPKFWEEQTSCMSIPHSGMIVTTDLVDNLNDIHPSYKWTVGSRLANWALARDYGHTDIECMSPAFKSMKVEGNKVYIKFSHVGGGLVCKADDLRWFQVAGADGRYRGEAHAAIEGKDTVVAWADNVASPCYVRFAWDEEAQPALFSAEGLPVIPFRSNAENSLAADSARGSVKTLPASEYASSLKQAGSSTLLDVRTQDEYTSGHLKGAVCLDWRNAETFSKAAETLNRNNTIYVYCRTGVRSGEAAKFLSERGFNVINLQGGITAWQAQGLEVVK